MNNKNSLYSGIGFKGIVYFQEYEYGAKCSGIVFTGTVEKI